MPTRKFLFFIAALLFFYIFPSVYFFRVSSRPEVYKPNEPLTYRNISVYRLKDKAVFNLQNWRGTGGTAYTVSAENGGLVSTQTGKQIY